MPKADRGAKDMPNLSIIVPVYNTREILQNSINSILQQTYEDYELIIVDDGSSDGSSALCDELKENDERIVVVHKKNGGLSDARNEGIKIAKGNYFLFVDSDDRIHERFCELLMGMVELYGCEIASSDLLFTNTQKEEPIIDMDDINCIIYEKVDVLREYFVPSSGRKIYHGICMKVYDRKIFEGLQFEKGRFHEDLFMTYKLLERCNRFAFIEKPLYYYYQNPKSITHTYSKKNFIDEYDAIAEMRNNRLLEGENQAYLRQFVLLHYIYLLTKLLSLEKSNEIDRIKHEIVKWIDDNIWKISAWKTRKKLAYLVFSRFPKLYLLAADIRGKTKRI